MGYSQPQTRRAVVPLPAEIDVTNARQAGRELLAAFMPGVTAVIADMTATTFCDSSGVHMLAGPPAGSCGPGPADPGSTIGWCPALGRRMATFGMPGCRSASGASKCTGSTYPGLIARLRAKPGADAIDVTVVDFATITVANSWPRCPVPRAPYRVPGEAGRFHAR